MTQRFRHLLPVVLGGDIGAYALARQLHEATGTLVTVVAPDPIVAILESTYTTVVHQEAGTPPERTIALLRELAQDRGPHSAAFMASTDTAAATISTHRAELESTYVLPFPDIDMLDAVSDKVSFSRLCAGVGVLTSQEAVVDPTNPDCVAPISADKLGMEFSLVTKVATGADYDRIPFPGKHKIWFIDDAVELVSMWRSLKEAGYRSTFLVQECIPGDDTAMRPVTVYMDSTGELRLIGSACVLLQDRVPTMIGSPVAMMTEVLPDLWEAIGRLLHHVGYHGFADLDIKVDPHDGRELFFEVNPCIGRNSFYLTIAGTNPMAVILKGLVLDQCNEPIEVTRQTLYSLVPDGVIARYVSDGALCRKAKGLGWGVDPLRDPAERSLCRRAMIELQRLSHYRKFAHNYPQRADRSR